MHAEIEERVRLHSGDADDLVERLVRLIRNDGGSEALPSTVRTEFLSDPDDVEQLLAICTRLERESSSAGFVVHVGKASPLDESEARRLVDDWLDRPDEAFGFERPRDFLNSAERRKYFETFVASLEGSIFS